MIRRILLFVISLIALSGSLVAATATINSRNFDLRGYVDPTQDSNLPYHIPRFGVNVELTQYSESELEQHLNWMEEAHVVWIRQVFDWNEIEPTQDSFKWAQWDQILSSMDERENLQVVAVLFNSPQWARTPQAVNHKTAPPENIDDFANFARAFAERYGHIIDYYQIWDEPNLDDAWGGLDPNPVEYLALLEAAYTAVHGVDENAVVISAALAPTTEKGGQNISDILYLEQLYDLGAKEYMDAVAGKPYGFNESPQNRAVDNQTLNFSRLIALREIMVEHGDGQKSLWASNWGWNHLPESWTGEPSIWGNVTKEKQQKFTIDALTRATREWAWLGGMILHQWQPDVADDDPQWGFAIINQQGEPRALLQSLKNRSIQQFAENALYHPITPYARYSGIWEFSTLGADIGWLETSDSQLEFDFYGQDIALLAREGDYVAFLYPTIDGQQANATPQDTNGNAYIFLGSPSLENEINLIPIERNLELSPHTLHMVADRGWNQWAIAGFAVSSGNLAHPYNAQISVALLTAIIASIATLMTGWQLPWQRFFHPLANFLVGLEEAKQLIISAITSVALLLGMWLTWQDSTPEIFRREDIHFLLTLLTGGLLTLSFHVIITILAILLLFVLIYNNLKIGLILALFWSPFFVFPVQLHTFAFPMVEVLILITTAAWLLHQLVHWGRNRQSANSAYKEPSPIPRLIKLHPIDYGIIAWVLLGVFSLVWANRLPEALTEFRTMMLQPALFYLIYRTINVDKKTIVQFVDTILFAGFIVAVYGLVTFFLSDNVITAEEGTQRLVSVYGSPNNVALFLGRCLPFAFAFLITNLNTKSDNHLYLKRRFWSAIVLGVMLVTILLTQSVGSILLGVPASVILIIALQWGKRSLLPIGAILGLLAIGLTVLSQLSARFASLLDIYQGTNFIRIRVWESAINILCDHPITGLGLDQFLYAFRAGYIRPDAIFDRDLSHPHNIILDFWLRLGILGMLLFLWLQAIFWRTLFQAKRAYQSHDPLLYALTLGTMGSMMNLLAHGLIDNSVYVIDLAYIFILLMSLAHFLSQNANQLPDSQNSNSA